MVVRAVIVTVRFHDWSGGLEIILAIAPSSVSCVACIDQHLLANQAASSHILLAAVRYLL